MVAGPVRVTGGLSSQVVRRLVGGRLPIGSLVVEAGRHHDSVLPEFAGDYRTLGVTRDHTPTTTVRADSLRLPLAAASADCMLLLDIGASPDGCRAALVEAGRVLRPGGLAVVAGAARPRGGSARLMATMGDAGLIVEQVHHLQFLLHPVSLVARARARRVAGSRKAPARPWLCRAAAMLERADGAGLWRARRVPASGLLAFGRKP